MSNDKVAPEWIPTKSPWREAHDLLNDCRRGNGELDQESVFQSVTRLIRQRNVYMERLGLIQTIKFSEAKR